MNARSEQLYRHCGVGLVRAAADPPDLGADGWPELSETTSCCEWLSRIWASRPQFAEAVRHASPVLGDRLAGLAAGQSVSDKQVQRATRATVRYLLRASHRHTPFGLFAGVAPTTVGESASVRWDRDHRPAALVDNQWLATVIDYLEGDRELLAWLEVQFTNLVAVRGQRLELLRGPGRVTIRHTPVVQTVRAAAQVPIRFGDLVDKLAGAFPAADTATVERTLSELVGRGFLLTCLRAPSTEIDPLGCLVERLDAAGAHDVVLAAELLTKLRAIHEDLKAHNLACNGERPGIRARLGRRIDELTRELTRLRKQAGMDAASFGRIPLSLNLGLGVQLTVPEQVAVEMELAAGALIRLSRQPTGEPAWRDFYTTFCDRYGTGTLVPLYDLVDPGAGLGLPSGYPGSVWPSRPDSVVARDERLLAMAMQTIADNGHEIVLDDELIQSLAVGAEDAELRIPPHVELAARIHAPDLGAFDRGDYWLTVTPGRSAGTFTSRFTPTIEGAGLEEVYRALPTAVSGAVPVQMSFPPIYAHAENISRVPAYLPNVLAMGEHRDPGQGLIPLEDLAVTATRNGLHLVSVSKGQVVEPQVFHGLNLEKQPPTLARFLIHLSRGLNASWTEFDWGPYAARLPYLPRVRYRRAILARARWRLTANDLPTGASDDQWRRALRRWRDRWRCPESVELADADRTLRLDLGVSAHAGILRAHLDLHGHATLIESVAQADEYGWIGGYAHEIVLPLVSRRPPAPSPLLIARPVVTNRTHGQFPGSPHTAWLNVKVHTHPQTIDDLIVEYLPALLDALPSDSRRHWFIRYRSPHETDHLRLRIYTPNPAAYADAIAVIGVWAEQLRADAVASRLVVDTYCPEVGRYGRGHVLAAAENVFVADSRAVAEQLRHLPEQIIQRRALAAVNMLATAHGLLGELDAAIKWLVARPAPGALGEDRNGLRHAVSLFGKYVSGEPEFGETVAEAWQARADALVAYRNLLPPARANTDAVLESLLHMHHNRLIGVDRVSEDRCRRLARHTALAGAKQRSDR
ncbi:lantibiotic dehydratase [Pseudonocardia eucalypti]|uniref:Lantibiotic dehydratase n=1 Tax=Pseudonocardia eucalypti TaxID=648755 RepID=A0ABP9PZQ7_9PSEU|nr:thiopeptide-type bacteriocin biosynthesis protein [Pseudonocardia eucalypti]